MIPNNISRKHIERALDAIDREGIPVGREARSFALATRARRYPPKYVLAQANKFANGRALRPDEFSGGEQTNAVLRRLGYSIVAFVAPPPIATSAVASVVLESARSHDLKRRLDSMSAVLEEAKASLSGPALCVFPGGWFKAPSPKPVETIFDKTVTAARRIVRATPKFSVSFGSDGGRARAALQRRP